MPDKLAMLCTYAGYMVMRYDAYLYLCTPPLVCIVVAEIIPLPPSLSEPGRARVSWPRARDILHEFRRPLARQVNK